MLHSIQLFQLLKIYFLYYYIMFQMDFPIPPLLQPAFNLLLSQGTVVLIGESFDTSF